MLSRWGLACVALVCFSIDTPTARSQATGSATAPADPAATTPEGEDEDAVGSGSAAGSGSAVVAPKDVGARKAWLVARLDAALAARPTLARARIAYAIEDLATSDELASREPDTKLNLASNAKVLTAIAALSGLGGAFRWRTSVYTLEPPDETGLVKGDLYVRGRGDPTLSVAGLRQLAADVAAKGVRTVEGKLVIDATYFDHVVEPPHFAEQPKETAAFRAPVSAFTVNRSSYTVTIMAEPGGGARVTMDPRLDYLEMIKDEVTSVTSGRTRLKLDAKTKPDVVELEITGQIRAGEGSWDLRRRVDDPTRFAAEVLRRELAAQGIRIRKPKLGFAAVPLTARTIAHVDSPALNEVVRVMNKYSDNFIAETVLKTLGAETKGAPGPATWADGIAAVNRELAKYGLPAGGYRIGNGSGLFNATEVAPRQLVALLGNVHADYRIAGELAASLPTGGYDGTLARRYHGKAAFGRVRAKTGTLDKVTTLAGYVGVESNHLLAFAVLVNDIPPGQRPTVRALIDEMMEILVAYLAAS